MFSCNIRNAEHLAGEIQKALQLDPMTIAMIVQAIIAALRLWHECRTNGRRWRRTLQLGRGHDTLRAAVVQAIGEAGLSRLKGDEFLETLKRRGLGSRDAEIQDLYLV